jgi:hypothetical protein
VDFDFLFHRFEFRVAGDEFGFFLLRQRGATLAARHESTSSLPPNKSWLLCRVLARCGKFFVVVALVFSTGAHWAALQTVAWTSMLAHNLCSHSVSQAVSETFDGKHPCPLCKTIAAAEKSEKKSEALSPVLKMEFPSLARQELLFPPGQFELLPQQNFYAESLPLQPPAPPPRAFFI